MNLDKKLELAERVLIAIVQADNRNYNWDAEGVSALSFEVADAMEAEYNKRKKEEEAKDTECSKQPMAYIMGHRSKNITNTKEWQPNWSQAPDWANWWCVGQLSGKAVWSMDKPHSELYENVSYWAIDFPSGKDFKAPTFDYQGDWKDSLRKRP